MVYFKYNEGLDFLKSLVHVLLFLFMGIFTCRICLSVFENVEVSSHENVYTFGEILGKSNLFSKVSVTHRCGVRSSKIPMLEPCVVVCIWPS